MDAGVAGRDVPVSRYAGRNHDWKVRYDGGESARSIAESDGVTRQRVYQVLHEEGSTVLARKKKRRDCRETVIDMRRLGISTQQIAEETGYTVPHVQFILREHRKVNR